MLVCGAVAASGHTIRPEAPPRPAAYPRLGETFEQYMAANPNRSKRTNELYRYEANRYLGDWLPRPLDAIGRADVEARFNGTTADHGWPAANRAMSLLRSIERRPCVNRDPRIRRRLDHRPATRARAEDRRSDRGLGPKVTGSLINASGASAALQGYRSISDKFRNVEDFGPTSVRRFVEGSHLLGDRTADQWQQDAFGQVDAWLRGLGLRRP